MSNFLNKPYIQAVGNCQTVILSDSLMAHLWKENEFNVKQRPSFHCLVGAKIQDIQKLLPRIQNENAKIIVCVGINNVPSQSSARIIVQFQKLAESIGKEHVFCKLPIDKGEFQFGNRFSKPLNDTAAGSSAYRSIMMVRGLRREVRITLLK